MPRIAAASLLIFVPAVLFGCSPNTPQPAAGPSLEQSANDDTQPQRPEKLAAEHLPNPVRVHEKVISGGLPAGDAAFAELKSLGVKTVISVDGATPDVERAKKYGLRYVHLPHGYDGIGQQRTKELAKAVRELEGPIYIHCHHGKHRSPAAASVACVAAGLISPKEALPILEVAGTSESYRGLYESAQSARPFDESLLDELEVEFCEIVEIPPIAEAMVAIGHTHDHLAKIAAAGWKTPPEHPDLKPAHEALLLREHFTEMLRTGYVAEQPAEFRALLRQGEQAAGQLETQLRAWKESGAQAKPPQQLQQSANRIRANCKACHQQYRDMPLDEKANR